MRIFYLLVLVLTLSACVEHSKDELHSTAITVAPDKALEYLQDIAEDEPDNHQAFYQLAKINFEQGDYSRALANIQKARAIRQDEAEYAYLEGKIYSQLKRPELAVKSLLLAETMGKKSTGLYQVVAGEYLKMGEVVKAKQAIDQLTAVNNSAEGYTLKGMILLASGDTAVALQNFRGAVALDTAYVEAWKALFDIHSAKGYHDQAFKDVDMMLKLQPANLDFLERKGKLLSRTGDLDSAKVVFRYIAEKRGRFMDYYELSNAYYLLRQYDSAQYAAEKAYELNEDFLEAQVLVARSLDKKRRYQEAIEVYQAILATDSTYNLAIAELDNLKRKVAYLWRLEQQRRAQDSSKNDLPPPVQKKEIIDNQK